MVTSTNKKQSEKYKYNNSGYKAHHQEHITNENNSKYIISNSNHKNLNYDEDEFEEEEEEKQEKIEENNNVEINRKEDDGILTTTVTEVFKNGKLINEETKQEYGGRIKKDYLTIL